MKALGVTTADIQKEDLRPAGEQLRNYFANPAAISQELSVGEHRLMLTLGHASLPNRSESQDAAKNP
jgi:hypothetical protein